MAESDAKPDADSTAIPWQDAANYIDDSVTIEGPVRNTKNAQASNGSPTFLQLGVPYPDSGCFEAVIFGESHRHSTQPPEVYYYGKTIAVTGTVTEYEDTPQIVVSSPSQIEVVLLVTLTAR